MIAYQLQQWGEAWFAVLGLVTGSFLNAVIYRLPRGFMLTLPKRSLCPTCKTKLKWSDNIPLLSFIILKGKCRYCKSSIGARYPLVEMITALLFFAVYKHFGFTFDSLFLCTFAAALLAVTFIDIDFRIIPDEISIGGTVLVLLVRFFQGWDATFDAVLGILSGAGFFYLMAWIYKTITKREGLGFGDIKLLALIGAALGPKGAFMTIILSSFVGSIVGLILMFAQEKKEDKNLKLAVPYGPFLAIGALVFIFWGDVILLRFYPVFQ